MSSASKPKNLSNQVFSGISWSYASAIISALLHIISLSLLAHLLLPSEFGILGMALLFVSFAERIGQIGVGPAIIQKQEISDRQLAIAASTGILSGLLMYAIFYALSPLAASFFNEPKLILILRVLAIVFITDGIGMVSDSRLQRKLRFKALLLVDNLSYLIGGCMVSATLAYLNFGVWSLVWGLIATRFIKLIMVTIIEPQRLCLNFSIKEATPLLQFGLGFSLGRLLNFSALYGDNCVVGRILGSEALGLYSRAYQLMTLPTTYFAQIIDRVLFPAMSKKQDSLPHLRKAYFLSVDAIAIVSMPLSVVMYLGAKEIVMVIMGHQWTEMVPILSILSIGIFFRTAYKSGDTLTRSLGAVYRHAYRQAIYTFAVVVGSLIGAHLAGLQGVAVSILVSVTLNYILMTQLSLKLLKSSWKHFFKSHLPGLWISIWIAAGLIPLEYMLESAKVDYILRLTIISAFSATVALLSILFAPKVCRSQALSWFVAKIKIDRFGIIGRRIEKAIVCAERNAENV